MVYTQKLWIAELYIYDITNLNVPVKQSALSSQLVVRSLIDIHRNNAILLVYS